MRIGSALGNNMVVVITFHFCGGIHPHIAVDCGAMNETWFPVAWDVPGQKNFHSSY